MTTRETHQAKDVANFITYLATKEIVGDNGEREGIIHPRLQAVLYLTQAYYLAVLKRPIIVDEFYAWGYGPIIREIYSMYQKNIAQPIMNKDDDSGLSLGDKDILEHVVWSYFGRFSASFLISAASTRPWMEARERGDKIISQKSIGKYYKKVFK